MDAARSEFFGAADIVNIVGVAAVDKDVVLFEFWQKAGDCRRRRQRLEPSTRWRGFWSLPIKSSMEEDPVAPSFASSSTVAGVRSYTTHLCPAFSRRRTMLAPILPNRSFRVALCTLLSEETLLRNWCVWIASFKKLVIWPVLTRAGFQFKRELPRSCRWRPAKCGKHQRRALLRR